MLMIFVFCLQSSRVMIMLARFAGIYREGVAADADDAGHMLDACKPAVS